MNTTEAGRDSRRVIRVAHSPDSDDAFMFYGLASGEIDTAELGFEHELQGIQELNERAMRGELEVTATDLNHEYLEAKRDKLGHLLGS